MAPNLFIFELSCDSRAQNPSHAKTGLFLIFVTFSKGKMKVRLDQALLLLVRMH